MKLFGKQLEAKIDELIEDASPTSGVKDVLSALFAYCTANKIYCDKGEARRIVQSKMGLRQEYDKLVSDA
jgi:hypothetical protein